MIDENAAKHLFAQFLTGVSLVTCVDAAGRPTGMTASAITPLGLAPASLIVCVGLRADVLPDLLRERRFSVHLLRPDQEDLAWAFAMDGPAKRERLEQLGLNWQWRDGQPLLPDCLARIDCRLQQDYDGGDHRILVGLIESGDADVGAAPMIYFRGQVGGRLQRD